MMVSWQAQWLKQFFRNIYKVTIMKIRLFMYCLVTSALFAMWQDSVTAGCFVMALMGFVLSAIDYCKSDSED